MAASVILISSTLTLRKIMSYLVSFIRMQRRYTSCHPLNARPIQMLYFLRFSRPVANLYLVNQAAMIDLRSVIDYLNVGLQICPRL